MHYPSLPPTCPIMASPERMHIGKVIEVDCKERPKQFARAIVLAEVTEAEFLAQHHPLWPDLPLTIIPGGFYYVMSFD